MTMTTLILAVIAIIILIILVAVKILNYVSPEAYFTWFSSGSEEKIELSKNYLYNANGYIVHSGSDIYLGSTGSFQRFDSVDRNAHEGEIMYSQPKENLHQWRHEDVIPPQPLRPAPQPLTLIEKTRLNQTLNKKKHDTPLSSTSAPLKSIPRPIPRKQLSAPAGLPVLSLQKESGRQINNPFLNGTANLETKTSFFSISLSTENERVSKSAISTNNPFISSGDIYQNIFDFNPKTIKSVLEEASDDGYLGDNDDIDEVDFRFKTEERINMISPLKFSTDDRKKTNFSDEITNKDKRSECEMSENLVSEESLPKRKRSRFFSENESFEVKSNNELNNFDNQNSIQFQSNGYPNGKRLLKTPSETYLELYSLMRANQYVASCSIVRNSSLRNSTSTKTFQSSTQTLNNADQTSQTLSTLKRTSSNESVSSESSVIMNTLERTRLPITGKLCIAVRYQKKNTKQDKSLEEIQVTVLEARDLLIPTESELDGIDTFVRVYLVPDESTAMQTKTFKNSKQPSYQETFDFSLNKDNVKHSLWFHLYLSNSSCTTLIGETEMKLTDFRKPVTMWLQLNDSRNNSTSYGDIMFSLSYLPTAERLTIVVVKARNLKLNFDESKEPKKKHHVSNVHVKVYLLNNGRKVCKKRTATKRGEVNIVFNEAIIFSVPPYLLNSLQVRLTILSSISNQEFQQENKKTYPELVTTIGHVIIGNRTDGKGLLHWHQMISQLRRPVAMFHPIRKTIEKKEHKD